MMRQELAVIDWFDFLIQGLHHLDCFSFFFFFFFIDGGSSLEGRGRRRRKSRAVPLRGVRLVTA